MVQQRKLTRQNFTRQNPKPLVKKKKKETTAHWAALWGWALHAWFFDVVVLVVVESLIHVTLSSQVSADCPSVDLCVYISL